MFLLAQPVAEHCVCFVVGSVTPYETVNVQRLGVDDFFHTFTNILPPQSFSLDKILQPVR